MNNIMCTMSYDGSKFNGFQCQKGSVYNAVESALKSIGIDSKVMFASRTDKGVHGLNQVISFRSHLHFDLGKLKRLLNERLFPNAIINRVLIKGNEFHPRYHAKVRVYKYIFSTTKELPPFMNSYVAYLRMEDMEKAKLAIREFIGTHDFTLFKKGGSPSRSNIREIYDARLFRIRPHRRLDLYCLSFSSNGFLRAQIRLIVQSIMEFSNGKIDIKTLRRQIDNQLQLDKCIREPAPANGLYLHKILY